MVCYLKKYVVQLSYNTYFSTQINAMKIKHLLFPIFIFSLNFFPSQEKKVSEQKMKWFQDAKLGIFIHWGIYSVNGISESWAFFNNYISHPNYMKVMPLKIGRSDGKPVWKDRSRPIKASRSSWNRWIRWSSPEIIRLKKSCRRRPIRMILSPCSSYWQCCKHPMITIRLIWNLWPHRNRQIVLIRPIVERDFKNRKLIKWKQGPDEGYISTAGLFDELKISEFAKSGKRFWSRQKFTVKKHPF